MRPIIHIVLGRANPNRMNGVNRVVHNLAEEQHALGWKVSVWGITASYNKADELVRNYHSCWFPDSGYLKISPELKAALQTSAPNTVFHFHGGFIPHFILISRYLRKISRSYVLTPHGTFTQGAMEQNRWVKKLYFRFLEKPLLNKAQAIQCLGHSEQSDLEALTESHQIELIPNGQNFDELVCERPVHPSREFIIGYCGRIEERQKGLDILLKSFRFYREQLGGKGKLHLIGDGPYLLEMKALAAELELDSYICFWGKKFDQEKLQLLSHMKLFVHSSRNEGLPTAVIEALSLGIPCLVSKASSMDTYVKMARAGWTYEEIDIPRIARYFREAEREFETGKLKERSIRAFEMARREFSWREVAQKTQRLYQ
ncbi:MAG: glycosyltransferase family 4 protein [Bacteroidota bacterium]